MKSIELSPVDQALFDGVVSAFPSEPMTDEEFEEAQRLRDDEWPIGEVIGSN